MTIATVLSALALLTFMAWTAILVLVVRVGLLPKLGAVDEASSDDSQLLSPPPRVSVIVPAHNEERGIAESLRSLLSMDYLDYEVIFVNDRSIDRTGDIAEEFVAKDKRLKVIHIEELPPGWFGKNHAAWCGAQAASGEIILFTDADVIIAPDALSRAVNYLIGENLQFLGVVPGMIASGALLKASITAAGLWLYLRFRPWKMRDPDSSAYFGVGPFIMFRADSYHSIGGHSRIALRPDEDVQLGKLAKRSGLRADLLAGIAEVKYEWMPSTRGLVRGYTKNFFASLEYSVLKVLAWTVVGLWLGVSPFVLTPLLVLMGEGILPTTLLAASACLSLLLVAGMMREARYEVWNALLFPLGVLVSVFAMWRSMIVAMTRGIAWGGEPIPLSELRNHRI